MGWLTLIFFIGDLRNIIFSLLPSLSLHFILLLIFWFMLGIVIHEIGHLFCGLLSGYKFTTFQIVNLLWLKKEERIIFKFVKEIIPGQCIMEPANRFENFKFFWYNFGGVFFNFILMLVCGLILIWVNKEGFWNSFLFSAIIMNSYHFLTNIIPIEELANDGYNIKSGYASEEERRGIYTTLLIYSGLQKGLRYRDFDSKLFKIDKGTTINKFWSAYLVVWEFSRLDDLGQIKLAIEQLQRIKTEKLPKAMRAIIKINFLYYYLINDFSPECAKELYECEEVNEMLKAGGQGMSRIQAAYAYFIINDKIKFEYFMEKAENEAKKIREDGLKEMEFEKIEALKSLTCFTKIIHIH